MFERPANRIYRISELGVWFRRIELLDIENSFRPDTILYGRKLYKDGVVKSLELNTSNAILIARLDDGSEPYCVIDFDGDNLVKKGNDLGNFQNNSLTVAGLYEIEETIADLFSSNNFIDYDEFEAIERAKALQLAEDEDANANAKPKKTRNSKPRARKEVKASLYPKLCLHFSSRKKGLVFIASWQLQNGKFVSAFGDKCLPIMSLPEAQKDNLVRLVTMSRKAGFKFDGGHYTLAEIAKIPHFMQETFQLWKTYFSITNDANVELLKLGERIVQIRPIAKKLSENDIDFDIEWCPTIGGEVVDDSELPKLISGGISTLKIVPNYGILHVSNNDTAFVRNVERARDFGFQQGKIPRYMLLSLSDFGAGLSMSDSLKKWVNSLTARNKNIDDSLFPSFLRNYQKYGVMWVRRLFEHDCNVLIADEMGLGKTMQTLSIIDMSLRENVDNKYFVVCPASVIPVWVAEARKFFGNIKCGVFSAKANLDDAQLWISSYTQLRRNRALVEKTNFEIAILDEAQFIKNPDAKTTSACMALKAKRKIALTGTPVENRLLDMWTTFRWLMPGLMGQRASFEIALQSDQNFVKTMRKQISPFVLRRLKSEVAKELPEKVYVDLVCPMTEQQKSEYQKLLSQAKDTLGGAVAEDSKARFTMLSLLTRLRQVSCDASLLPWVGSDGSTEVGGKISLLLDKLEELYYSGKKILIFSQFTRFIDLIEKNISQRFPDAPIYKLTGATRDRAKPVEAFQAENKGSIMLLSLRAGGTGITLTSADYVFLADPWWNPAVEEQAIDRVHRIGRKGDVFVYRMIAQDTVEYKVQQLQVQKRKLFNDLLGGLKDVSNHVKFIETVSDILT